MTAFTKRAVDVFAPTTAGGAARGADMGEAMAWGTEVERAIEGAAAGRVDQVTWSDLNDTTGTRYGQPARVLGPDAGAHTDPIVGGTVPNVGEYIWWTVPAGWRRVGNLQQDLVHASNTGAGTANAVKATSDVQFSATAYAALITVNFVAVNTGAMTLSINGETPRPLVTNTGEAVPAGYIQPKMSALVQIDSDGNYRLFSYGDASAVQAAAEAAQAAAEAARDAAIAAVPNASPATRTVLKALDTDTITTAYLKEPGREGQFIWRTGDYSAQVASDPAEGVYVKATAIAATAGAWVRQYDSEVWAEWFGAYGDNSTNCTNAVLKAIAALRLYPKDNIDTIGGSDITMYRSGRINFGPGIFRVDADALEFTADMGLTFVGAGSRGMTNAMRSRTTLLIQGASSGFGIRAYRGGARGLAFRNIDVCYESASFTGDLVDNFSAPHLSARDSFFGTFGIVGGGVDYPVRRQTARSLIRTTYDEGTFIDRCVFDGADVGFWSDDVREELGNVGFGGWGTTIRDTIFYDFATNHVLQAGARSRSGYVLSNVAFNPLNVSPNRALDITNIRGMEVGGCSFVSSVASAPATEWARVSDCTGIVSGNRFGSLANGMSIEGLSDIAFEANSVETGGLNHGLRVRAGTVRMGLNKYYGASNAILLQSDGVNPMHITGGGDRFRSDVASSINVIAANAQFISGAYDYDTALDLSVSKFTNNAQNLKIGSTAGAYLNNLAATDTIPKYSSGREIRFKGTSDQVITMTAPHQGTWFTFVKLSDYKLTINAPSGSYFYTGNGAPKTKIEVAAVDYGVQIDLVSYDTAGWRIRVQGTATLT